MIFAILRRGAPGTGRRFKARNSIEFVSEKWFLPKPERMLAGTARHFPSDNLKKAISFRFKHGGNPL